LPSKKEITQLLEDLNSGKIEAEEKLLPLIYDELHALASYFMRDERAGHTLQTTALVHEAYLRLSGMKNDPLNNKTHYMRLAATAMRRVLIDHARKKNSLKGGGGRRRELIEMADEFWTDSAIDPIELDQAIEKLAKLDSNLAQIVELRFFAGLTVDETACVIGLSPRTVKYDWKMAKAWLKKELE